MMRSLFAGVSGLRNHQVRMDVIGNNIANVNTVAFKSSRVTFKEAFAQMVQGASRPAGNASSVSGGTNPIQVGLGMNIGSVDLLFTQGNLENTGVTTDLAIQGDAFFVVSDGRKSFFTRSGNFQLDADGRLVASTNGFVVQGRVLNNDGELSDTIGDIVLPFGQKSSAKTTTSLKIGGNLDAEVAAGEDSIRETTMVVYDSMGVEQELSITFERSDGPGYRQPPRWHEPGPGLVVFGHGRRRPRRCDRRRHRIRGLRQRRASPPHGSHRRPRRYTPG